MSPQPLDNDNVGPRPTTCPQCGTLLPMEGRFCGQCGHVLSATPPVPAVEPLPPVPPPEPPPAPEPAPAAPPAPAEVRHAYRTMIGMSAVSIPSMPPIAPEPAAPTSVPAPVAPAPVSTSVAPPAVAPLAPVRNAHQTMMGVAAVASPSAKTVVIPPSISGPLAVANAAHTMMGVVVAEAPRTRSEVPPMMGGGAPGVAPKAVPVALGQRVSVVPSSSVSSPDDIRTSRPSLPVRSRGPGALVGLALAIGAIAAGGAWFFTHRGHEPAQPVQASLESDAQGVSGVTVVVPGQPAGTQVRFGNQTQTLDAAGHAHFALDASVGNRVGAIDLSLTVLPPNAAPEPRTARIVVGYRVDPDLAGLASEPPTLRLLFRVVPGARLSIEGQPVATDASGAGVATMDNYPAIAVDAPAVRAQTLHVEVHAPDGTTTQGTYELRVPRSALTVDRPVADGMTLADHVVVRGHANGARRVTVNQLPAELHGDVFEASVPMATVGHQTVEVRAFSSVGAPALARLDVERVAAGDRTAAQRFLQGSTLGASDLAHGALAPGQRVRFAGRMLGAPRSYDGGLTFQLVVNDRACAATPCLVWVDTDPGVATTAAGGTLDVVGVVTGHRAAVTANGERRSDPIVAAALIQ